MSRISRALVTGGAGFIGSHIVDELIHRGVETLVIDDLSTGSIANLHHHKSKSLLRTHVSDIREAGRLLQRVGQIDVVFHEAAIASVPLSVTQPMRVHDVNVTATLELLRFCVAAEVKRFVFASSAAVYGALEGREASEDELCYPSSPYGASKLAVESYLSAFGRTYGLETVALRYFNVYGDRQRANDGYGGVITIFANNLLNEMNPTIYGDGHQTRDFVHVRDVARANLAAAEAKNAADQVFNVASGKSVSIMKLFELLRSIVGVSNIGARFAPSRAGDVRSGSASIKKITRMLDYEPRVELKDGLTELVESLRETTMTTPHLREVN
jgi:nucleoside-diphosphate-sugar epimerase